MVVTDYAEGELFQILEDDGNLPEEQVTVFFTGNTGNPRMGNIYLHKQRDSCTKGRVIGPQDLGRLDPARAEDLHLYMMHKPVALEPDALMCTF